MDIKYFRLGDTPTQDECDRLGVLRKNNMVHSWAPPERDGEFVKAKRTEEFRAPRQGEWYLSGAIPLAYRAPSNLRSKYRIMKLVVVERQTHEVIREIR
jgi:hypothetical protein